MQNEFKPLNLEVIQGKVCPENLHYFNSLDSTNNWLLAEGKCGDICISESQTLGRGRRGNTWKSPKGNVSFSLCFCFNEINQYWSLLGLITGIAIAEALEDIGIKGQGIKWPNDIYWQRKKLGGILLETLDQSGRVVIGIGLNVSMPTDIEESIEQQVISLDEIIAENPVKHFSREVLYIQLINRVNARLNAFERLDYEEFIQAWKKWDILLGKHVTFDHQDSCISGEVVEIDKHGRIGILSSLGELRFYTSADIKLAKNGYCK